MKTGTILLVVVLVILALLGVSGCSQYNTFVEKDANVETAWANVETAYQRRSDLIPNLVNTVKGSADFERSTLNEVIEARSKATSIQLSADDLTPENLARYQEAQSELSGSLSRLLVAVERYPELRTTDQFRDLQTQLEGTENRINVARTRYNEEVRNYNVAVRRFPGNFFASITGFDEATPFEAEEGADRAPTVDFGTAG